MGRKKLIENKPRITLIKEYFLICVMYHEDICSTIITILY
jgi:uncharacterized protein (UPF0262 family)